VSSPRLQPLISAIGQVLLGKEQAVRLALACLLARGHLLIEDLPGMGKTTLANGADQRLQPGAGHGAGAKNTIVTALPPKLR
jgi:MoxR-like ATPase